jgi:hypothetical protein
VSRSCKRCSKYLEGNNLSKMSCIILIQLERSMQGCTQVWRGRGAHTLGPIACACFVFACRMMQHLSNNSTIQWSSYQLYTSQGAKGRLTKPLRP